jgi:hypothetical protein
MNGKAKNMSESEPRAASPEDQMAQLIAAVLSLKAEIPQIDDASISAADEYARIKRSLRIHSETIQSTE